MIGLGFLKTLTLKGATTMLVSVVALSAAVGVYTQNQQRTVQTFADEMDLAEKCENMTVVECKEYVSTHSKYDEEHVKIAYPRKFNYYRIWIEVDEEGIVTSVPGRG